MDLKKNFINTLKTKIFIQVFGIVSSVIYARILGPTGYGAGVLILIFPPIVIKFMNVGVAGSLTYFLNKYPDERKKYIGTALGFSILLSIAVTGLLLFMIPFIMQRYYKDAVPVDLLRLIFVLTPLYVFSFYFKAVLKALGRIREFNRITEINPTILRFLLTLLLIVFLRMGLKGYVYLDILVTFIVTLHLFIVLWKSGSLAIGFHASMLGKMLYFGVRGYFTNISAALSQRIDKLILGFFLAPEHVGIYQIAVNLAGRLLIVSRALGLPLLPKLASLSTREAFLLSNRLLNKMLIPNLIISVGAILVAPVFIYVMYGEKYMPAYQALVPMAVATSFLAFNKIISAFFVATGRPEIKSAQRIASLVTKSLLLYFLVEYYGILGCGLSIFFSELIIFILGFFYYKRFCRFNEKRVFNLSREEIKTAVIEMYVEIKMGVSGMRRQH